jgi:hypothetical protein
MTKIIKRPTYVSESRPRIKYRLFLLLWYRLRDDVILRKSTVILTSPPTRALVSSDCIINQQSMISPTRTSHSIQAWQKSNSWPWAQSTATEPLNYSSCDYFSPNVCIYTSEHMKISKDLKFEISKNWPSQELNPCRQSHSQWLYRQTTGSCVGTSKMSI